MLGNRDPVLFNSSETRSPMDGVRIILLDMRTPPSGSVAWYQHRLFPTRFKTRESTVSRLGCSPETDCHICFLGRWETRLRLHVQLPERERRRGLLRQTPLRTRRTRRYPLLLSVGASASYSWACNFSVTGYHTVPDAPGGVDGPRGNLIGLVAQCAVL